MATEPPAHADTIVVPSCICGHPRSDHHVPVSDGRTTACSAEIYSESEGVDYPCTCLEYDPDDGHRDGDDVCRPDMTTNGYEGRYGACPAPSATPR